MDNTVLAGWFKKVHVWFGFISTPLVLLTLITGILLNHAHEWLPFLGGQAASIALDPFQSDRLIKGTYNGLYLSMDGGHSWEEIATQYPVEDVVSVVFSPDQQGTVYALMRRAGLIKSNDNGQIWEKVSLPVDPITQGGELKRVVIGREGVLYLDTTYGLIRSRDGGMAWTATAYEVEKRGLPGLISDLHTGRFFGSGAVFIYDLLAVSVIIAIITGFVIRRRSNT